MFSFCLHFVRFLNPITADGARRYGSIFVDLLRQIVFDELDQLFILIEQACVTRDGKTERVDVTDRADVQTETARHHQVDYEGASDDLRLSVVAKGPYRAWRIRK